MKINEASEADVKRTIEYRDFVCAYWAKEEKRLVALRQDISDATHKIVAAIDNKCSTLADFAPSEVSEDRILAAPRAYQRKMKPYRRISRRSTSNSVVVLNAMSKVVKHIAGSECFNACVSCAGQS